MSGKSYPAELRGQAEPPKKQDAEKKKVEPVYPEVSESYQKDFFQKFGPTELPPPRMPKGTLAPAVQERFRKMKLKDERFPSMRELKPAGTTAREVGIPETHMNRIRFCGVVKSIAADKKSGIIRYSIDDCEDEKTIPFHRPQEPPRKLSESIKASYAHTDLLRTCGGAGDRLRYRP